MKKLPTHIYALGGLEEIGKNTYVIEDNDSLIIIDAGIKFANDTLLGVDGMIANYEELKNKEKKIKALVITHGHEDHIGAIPHYLRHLNIPLIWAPNLAAKLIEKRLGEYKDIIPPPIKVFTDNDTFELGSLKVSPFRVCHSIPDAFGLMINSSNGKIISTGDFRFDFATDGDETDLYKLTQLSGGNVDVLLCESTSAEVPGFSESEKYIIRNIKEYMRSAKGRLFVSTFASNLSRIEEIIAFGINSNRKVLILGKSMEANVKISRKLGYLKVSDSDFIQAKDLPNYPDEEILIILTGSQGEEMAALNVLASGNHSKLSLKPSDTIILSSNPIPGNYAAVEEMINKLYKKGLTVYENRPDRKIHASGHATRSEQQLMFKAVNSKYIFPIHGEYKMLRMLRKNAVDVGYDKAQILIAKNGQKMALLDHELKLTDEYVAAGPLYLNGNEVNNDSGSLLKDRGILSVDGIIHIVLWIDAKNKKFNVSTLSTRGCFYAKESGGLVAKIISSLKAEINNKLMLTNWIIDKNELKELMMTVSQQFIWRWKKKNPMIKITIFDKTKIDENISQKNYVNPIEVKTNKFEKDDELENSL